MVTPPSVRLKLASAVDSQYVLLGKLNGLDAEDRVLIVVDGALWFRDLPPEAR